jgi:23S rRNA (uracil1939-C5)-methyltransferase
MKAETLTLSIDHIGAGGDGVAQHEGKSVFVPKTAAGDVITARVTSQNAEGIFARLEEILTPSPERREAPCRYYARCGSCGLQHLQETAYREWKYQKVRSSLERAGAAPESWLEPVFLPAAGRRRVSFNARRTKAGLIFGYNEERSHTVLDIQTCIVLAPALDEKLQALRSALTELIEIGGALDVTLQMVDNAFDLLLIGEIGVKGKLSYNQHEALADMARLGITRIAHKSKPAEKPQTLLVQEPVVKTFGALKVELSSGAFLQASDAGEEALVRLVKDFAGDAKKIADLFCGGGLFAGHLIENAHEVYAADSDALTIQALQKSAAAFKNLRVEKRDLFKEPLGPTELNAFDTVILDPPRAGAKAQAEMLARSSVPKIVSVSCNPTTFIRDVKILQEAGYVLRKVVIIDQFVYSAHCEIIGVLEKA